MSEAAQIVHCIMKEIFEYFRGNSYCRDLKIILKEEILKHLMDDLFLNEK